MAQTMRDTQSIYLNDSYIFLNNGWLKGKTKDIIMKLVKFIIYMKTIISCI